MKRLISLLLCLLLLCPSALGEEAPAPAPEPATLTASADVHVRSDAAVLTFLFETEGKTVTEAQDRMDELMTALRATLAAQGIAQDDLRSHEYDVKPINEYHYTKITDSVLLTGYSVISELGLHMQNTRNAAKIIDAVNASGFECSYDLSRTEDTSAAAHDEALSRAVSEAMRKAQVMADAAGLKLGRLVSISENPSASVVEVTYTVE